VKVPHQPLNPYTLYFLLSRVLARVDRAHKQELQTNQLLNHYLSVSPAICFTLDVNQDQTRCLWVSENIRATLGYSTEEALVANWWKNHIYPEDVNDAVARYQAFVASRSSLDHEYRFCRKDGSLVWIRDQLRYVSGDRVSHDTIVGAWTDITDQKRSHQEMIAASERRRILFEEARDGICVLDSSFAVVDANHSFASMTGLVSKDMLLGKHPWDWDDNYPTEEEFRHVFSPLPDNAFNIETVFRRPDGSTIDVEISINPVGVGGSQLFFTLCRDISERLCAESELEDYNRELSALFNISASLRKATDAASLFNSGIADVTTALDADASVIAVLSDDCQQYLVEQAAGAWESLVGKSFNIADSAVARTVAGNTVFITEDGACEAYDAQLQLGVGPAVFVPLKWGGDNEGVLAVGRSSTVESHPFNDNDVRLLSSIGEMMGVALHRIHLMENMRRRLANIQALRNIDMAIAGSLDLRVIYNVALNEIISQLDVDAATILSVDVHSQRLEYAAGKGFYYHRYRAHLHCPRRESRRARSPGTGSHFFARFQQSRQAGAQGNAGRREICRLRRGAAGRQGPHPGRAGTVQPFAPQARSGVAIHV